MLKPVLAGWAAILSLSLLLGLPGAPAHATPALPKLHGTVPADEWQNVETDNANIFYTDHSLAREDLAQIKELIEKDVDQLATLLQIRLTRKFNVLLYSDRLQAPRGRWGLYIWPNEDPDTIHVTYDEQFRHNMNYRGGPNDFFLGGITVIYGFILNPDPSYIFTMGLALHVADSTYPHGPLEIYVKQDLEEGKLVPLEQLDRMKEEELLKKARVIEPEAGAFAHFLIRNEGFARFLQVYRKASPRTVAATVQEVYGRPLSTLEGEFRAYLRNYIVPRTRPPRAQPERSRD